MTVSDCWMRGFSIKEAAERSYMDEGSVRRQYEELEREMREYFIRQREECP